jgi:hypothetical protein
MTMNGRSCHSPTSKIVTVFGSPESLAAASASRVNLARTDGSRAKRSASTLIATVRSSSESSALKISPMPPYPILVGLR